MIITRLLSKIQGMRFGVKVMGNTFIHPLCIIKKFKKGRIILEPDLVFSSNTYIECQENALLEISEGCVINSNARIQTYNHIKIGMKVIIGPFAYLCDFMHNYEDTSKAIKDQGCRSKGAIVIDEGTWIGASATILAPVRIGKGCVIGANSLINKDIPDYSVAVGNPARIVKQYDFTLKEWVHVQN